MYVYDNAGNITEAKRYLLTDENEEVSPSDYIYSETYVYSDSAWGDRLTSYNGVSITYDGIGNPLSYYNGTSYSFTWTGRQLTGASLYGNVISFTYNDEGIRTSKTKNGVTTKYYLSGTTIVAEETSGNVTIYLYDESGAPIGFQYRKSTYSVGVWDTYWYEKNLHGDIVAIYSDTGVKLVTYTYDAWGNTTIGYHNNALTTTVVNNPFTYRGYYYDSDIGLYYLNSRYYDSRIGRFLNVDDSIYHSMLGYNMFAYCYNNPVYYFDPTGESAAEILKWWTAVVGTSSVAEPTPFGEIVFIAGVAIIGGIIIGEKVADGIQYFGSLLEETNDVPQSITEPDDESEELSPNISKAKDTKKDSNYKAKKVAPRIKSNNKKTAREKAFLKGGKLPPIHHPNGKYGPHFHPNNPKFSHWHYYYILIFSVNHQEHEG